MDDVQETALAGYKHDVMLSPVAETLLIPIAARAYDAESATPILGDAFARPVMQRLTYDFDKVGMSPVEIACIAIRTLVFDAWTASFIQRRSRAVVVHLGCGLDARSQRLSVDNNVLWIDVDLPEVIAVRLNVMQTSFTGFEYRLLAADIATVDWLESIPRDRPTVIVVEGVLSYLNYEDSQALLRRLATHFDEGEILLDCISPLLLSNDQSHPRAVRKIGAKFRSAVDDLRQLEAPSQRLEVIEAIRFVEAPGVEKLPWQARLRMYLVSWIPKVRDSARLVRLRFEPSVNTRDRRSTL